MFEATICHARVGQGSAPPGVDVHCVAVAAANVGVGLLMQQASASASQPIWGGAGAAEQLGDHLHAACPASNTKQSSWKCQQQQQQPQRTMGESRLRHINLQAAFGPICCVWALSLPASL